MKKIIFISTLSLLVFGSISKSVSAAEESDVKRLMSLQPGITKSEVMEGIKSVSQNTGMTETEVAKSSIKELEEQFLLDRREASLNSTRGGSSGNYKLSKSTNKGDVFYTPSSTLGIQHGHSGIYFAKDTIIESIPKTGVRKLAYNKRNVEKNAVMQTVDIKQAKRNAAADWAKSRIGDKYSLNFANNKNTTHDGDKNCSKLLWSAFKLKGGVDLDGNGGLGVYPRDIRDSKHVKTYKTIK